MIYKISNLLSKELSFSLLLLLMFYLSSCGPISEPFSDTADTSKQPTDTGGSDEENLPQNPEKIERSLEAEKLLNYFKEISGKKMLSGCMANVNWNINEAAWIYKHTGKYPAINCFDFLHIMYSPSSWIDYSNTQVAENWWNSGGIVSAMWHWNMISNDKTSYTTRPGLEMDNEHTSFDLRKIDDTNSAEYKQLIADIDKVAGYLKLLRDKNIPVLWRPLHEAGGNYYHPEWGHPYWSNKVGLAWFWWGYYGPEYFKKIWHLMHDRFTKYHKLNNLIWVWNFEPTDTEAWFPGEDYVDITGSDIYNITEPEKIAVSYNKQKEVYPQFPAAMSECGSVAEISRQWKSGAKWVYFTTWYDFERTNSLTDADFDLKTHANGSIDWWNDVFACDFVISRDKVPNLKR